MKLTGRWRYVRLAGVMVRLPYYSRVVWGLYRDPRVPVGLKALLTAALAYVIMPFDLVPDAIPMIGQADDLTVLLLTLDLFIHNAPAAVRSEHIDRARDGTSQLDVDLARLRRLLGHRYDEIRDNLPQLLERYGELRDPRLVSSMLAGLRSRRASPAERREERPTEEGESS